ncbi:MAG TPA: O-antigen ligase family protein [Thermoanaerobaculia bacterium]
MPEDELIRPPGSPRISFLNSQFHRYLPDTSGLVRAACVFYLLHLLFQAKVAGLEIGAFFCLLCLGWAAARREMRLSFHILYFPLAVYGIASTTSALLASEQMKAFADGMLWFKMLIFPGAVILFRQVPRLRELAIVAYAVFAATIATYGLYEFFLLDRRDLENRITGPASHVMTLSGLLLPLALMFLFLWLHQRKWWQLTAGSLATITLLLTFTRSVWIGWTVAIVTLLIATRARLVFYALPLVIIFVTFLPLSLFGRLVSTFDTRQLSNFDRIRMVEAGVEMIKDRPLLGVGPANVKSTYSLYMRPDAPRPRPPHLHNNVVQIWAERGILALCAYLLLLGLFLRECIRGWHGPGRMWAEIGIAAAISLTVAGLFEFNFGDTEVFYLLLNLFALVVVSLERTRLSNEVPSGVVAGRTWGEPDVAALP